MANFETIFYGGRPGAETSNTVSYMAQHIGTANLYKAVHATQREVVRKYDYVLTDNEIARATAMAFECKSPEEYRSRFLTTILMQAYQVYNETHVRYPDLLLAIDKHNPECVDRFVREHERKIERCKTKVYTVNKQTWLPNRKIWVGAL